MKVKDLTVVFKENYQENGNQDDVSEKAGHRFCGLWSAPAAGDFHARCSRAHPRHNQHAPCWRVVNRIGRVGAEAGEQVQIDIPPPISSLPVPFYWLQLGVFFLFFFCAGVCEPISAHLIPLWSIFAAHQRTQLGFSNTITRLRFGDYQGFCSQPHLKFSLQPLCYSLLQFTVP